MRNLKKHWKEIRSEGEFILKNSPRLNISRKIEDWHNANNYVDTIINKYGWIKSWKNKNDEENNEENKQGNNDWLNYGIYYDSREFVENVKYCPKTIELLRKMKNKINICGFSYLKGNTILEKHCDDTGIRNNSLAYHLGLIIPKMKDTCQLIIKNNGLEYKYIEKEGDVVIFDATYEHYAFNQSSEDRVILYIDFKTQ